MFMQLKIITPKAFANSSPGFEHRENPGYKILSRVATLKGLDGWRTLSGFTTYFVC